MAAERAKKSGPHKRNAAQEFKKTEHYKENARALGQRIIWLRHTRTEWSQQDLADACGMSRQAIQLIETGKTNVTFASLVMISDALGVPIHELFSEDS